MELADHFEAVVVGSGFGGSVITYRLAEAGIGVCLLERGKAYPPGSFPRAPYDLAKNFWDPSERLYGMYNVWSFKGSGAVVSSGLGGGSLIYANILIRKDDKWFRESLPEGGTRPWPIQYEQIERHYGEVERMMNAQKYPLEIPPFDTIKKTRAMQEAAGKLNSGDLKGTWMPLNLAVSFRRNQVASPDEDGSDNPAVVGGEIHEEYENYHAGELKRDVPRSTCRLCGECDLGCNYGSKNTLDHTYITAAVNQKPTPAVIKILAEVKSIRPRSGAGRGYVVTYVIHDPKTADLPKDERPVPSEKTITCDYLILSAGTFGTPYLLLRSRKAFPLASKMLGERYSVNGDLLSFITNCIERRNGRDVPRRLDPSFGPVITSAIRFADDLDGEGQPGRGFYVEDGGHPYLMSWLAELSGLPGLLSRSADFLKIVLKYRLGFNQDADLGAEISDLIGDASDSMSLMPILSMGRDLPTARLFLTKDDRYLACDWAEKGSRDYYNRVRRAGKAIATAINAEYEDNPSYRFNFHQVLTAHPLGGCSMGESISDGVVDSCGEVFNYRDLFVADGSVMPGPVGPNPSLTIAAIANRTAEHIIAKYKGASHECSG